MRRARRRYWRPRLGRYLPARRRDRSLRPSVEGADCRELPAGVEQQGGRRPIDPDIAQHAIAIALDFEREARARSAAADPRIHVARTPVVGRNRVRPIAVAPVHRSEEHTSELQSRLHLVCRLLLEKKKKNKQTSYPLKKKKKKKETNI